MSFGMTRHYLIFQNALFFLVFVGFLYGFGNFFPGGFGFFGFFEFSRCFWQWYLARIMIIDVSVLSAILTPSICQHNGRNSSWMYALDLRHLSKTPSPTCIHKTCDSELYRLFFRMIGVFHFDFH